ncbi:MAG: HEAT repeat domain-containing protein [Planctomycetes bacterium]|nr:HEAT repeat domain-containing protein [Planctomycetota bacterium]
MRWIALLVLLACQEADPNALLRQLGDNDPAVREKATRALRALGGRAVPFLEKARESTDPELCARAAGLLVLCHRDLAQTELERQQRPRKLGIVTIDAADVPRAEVLRELEKQTGAKFKAAVIDLAHRVTVKLENAPLEQVLSACGMETDHYYPGDITLRERTVAGLDAFQEAGRFRFSWKPWAPKGEILGTIFRTDLLQTFDGEVEWDVAGIKTDHDLKVETCTLHSPGLVYVAGERPANPKVSLKGLRRWYCDTPVTFSNPQDGQVWWAGDYQISVRWPSILVRRETPALAATMDRVLNPPDVTFEVKPGREKQSLMGIGIGGGGGGRYGGRFSNEAPAWCGCPGKTNDKPRDPPPMRQERVVTIGHDADLYRIEDIAKIVLIFHKPVEEPFMLESPPLK